MSKRVLVRCFAMAVCFVSQTAFDIPGNTEHLLAPYDPACDHMQTSPAPLHPQLNRSLQQYFEAPIPRQIHQIWFGSLERMSDVAPSQWRRYAETFGYSYRLWTEADGQAIKEVMSPSNYALLLQYVRLGDYYGASDLLRLALLNKFGGIYADVDIFPPSWDGDLIDLATLVPMRNIVFVTERVGRNVIDSSMFVCNGFMMSSQAHPLIEHLVEHMEENVSALNEGPLNSMSTRIPAHTMYLTGPFYITRSLAGAVTVLPFNYVRAYHMLD